MRHTGGQCHCALFSEEHILGDEAFTHKHIAHQNVSVAQLQSVTCLQRVNIFDNHPFQIIGNYNLWLEAYSSFP